MTALERLRSSLPYRAARSLRYLVPTRPRPAILMYHRIAEETFDPWALAVTPRNFADQMKWIARHRSPLPLVEFGELHRRKALPADAIAVTFDDGYACNALAAAPMLEKFGIPATIFLPVEIVERGRPYWWHELERIVLFSNSDRLELDGVVVDLGPSSTADKQWQPGTPPRTPRQSAFLRLWGEIRRLGPQAIVAAIDSLREQSGVAPAEDLKRPMSVEEIRAITGGRIEFGSHSLSHRPLPLLGREEKEAELHGSIERCAALTGREPRTFAYPFGEFDSESLQLAEAAGFACACSAEHRWASPESNTYALPRLTVSDRGRGVLRRVLKFPPS